MLHPLTQSFVDKWVNILGNVSNPKLEENWSQNFVACDEIIRRNQNGEASLKLISPSSTGTGKSQNIIHKAISLYGTTVGTLIVVMRTADADIIVNQIQEETSCDYVAAYHRNESTINGINVVENIGDAKKFQCLVITHAMFKVHLEKDKQIDALMMGNGKRAFIVIDEEINAVTSHSLGLRDCERYITVLEHINKKEKCNGLKQDIDWFKGVANRLSIIHNEEEGGNSTFVPLRGMPSEHITILGNPASDYTLSYAIDALKKADARKLNAGSILGGQPYDERNNRAFFERMTKAVESTTKFLTQWVYKGTDSYGAPYIHTASEILPNISMVIMDATASVNSIYKLYEKYNNNLRVLPKIECRDYQYVTLHIAKTNTGKEACGANDDKDTTQKQSSISQILNVISSACGDGEEILIVVHRGLEAYVRTYTDKIENKIIHVDHWGNLTGSNRYRNCTTIILFGLNHKPYFVSRNAHTLAKGAGMAFLETEQNKDEVQSIIRTSLCSEIIQAINRVACRKPIDEYGNCISTKVFLTLPLINNGNDASVIRNQISAEMPNIKIDDWKLDGKHNKMAERSSYAEAILLQLDNMLNDDIIEVEAYEVKFALDIDVKSWSKTIKSKSFINMLESSKFVMYEKKSIRSKGRSGKPILTFIRKNK